jgi:hypothetical protein
LTGLGLRTGGDHFVGVAVTILLFIGVGAAGALLLRGHPAGLPLSIGVQFLQLPKLYSDAFSYEFYSPLTAAVELRPSTWTLAFTFETGGSFTFALGREVIVAGIGINLAAALILFALLRNEVANPLPTSGGLITR